MNAYLTHVYLLLYRHYQGERRDGDSRHHRHTEDHMHRYITTTSNTIAATDSMRVARVNCIYILYYYTCLYHIIPLLLYYTIHLL